MTGFVSTTLSETLETKPYVQFLVWQVWTWNVVPSGAVLPALLLWVIFALLDPDPDPLTWLNPDVIRIRNPDPDSQDMTGFVSTTLSETLQTKPHTQHNCWLGNVNVKFCFQWSCPPSFTFVGHYCPPGSGSGFRIRIRIHWPDWIRIQYGSETLIQTVRIQLLSYQHSPKHWKQNLIHNRWFGKCEREMLFPSGAVLPALLLGFIIALLDPDPDSEYGSDPLMWLNPNPIRIRIRNPDPDSQNLTGFVSTTLSETRGNKISYTIVG